MVVWHGARELGLGEECCTLGLVVHRVREADDSMGSQRSKEPLSTLVRNTEPFVKHVSLKISLTRPDHGERNQMGVGASNLHA